MKKPAVELTGLRIGQQPIHLCRQCGGLHEFSRIGQFLQRRIRRCAPKKVGEAGGEFRGGEDDATGGSALALDDLFGHRFGEIEKAGGRKDHRERFLDRIPRTSPCGALFPVESHESLHELRTHIPMAKGSIGEPGKNFLHVTRINRCVGPLEKELLMSGGRPGLDDGAFPLHPVDPDDGIKAIPVLGGLGASVVEPGGIPAVGNAFPQGKGSGTFSADTDWNFKGGRFFPTALDQNAVQHRKLSGLSAHRLAEFNELAMAWSILESPGSDAQDVVARRCLLGKCGHIQR